MKIYLNGQIIDFSDAKISIFDRGYLFGEGLFETLRSYNGVVPFLDKHLARLEWGATFLGVPFPHPTEMKRVIPELIKVNSVPDARIKIVLSMKGKSLRPVLLQDSMEPNLLIACEKFVPWSEEDYRNGVELAVIHEIKNDPPPSSLLKTTSQMTKMIARREIAEKDCFDGILLSADGYVTEATAANIFWVKDEKVFTAPTSSGLLPGITRGVVMELVRDNGYGMKEAIVGEEELSQVAEIFMTASTLEIMPVTSLDGSPIGDGRPGPMTQKILEFYQQRLQEEIMESEAGFKIKIGLSY